jgi:hypothetical protein
MRSRTLVLALAVTACERGAGEHEVEERPTAVSPAWFGYVATHWLPGPEDRRRHGDPTIRAALEARCPSCHATAAAHWQGSQHASAWSSAAFQTAFATEPLPACEGCHAPESANELEIGCVTCHVEPGEARIWTAGERLEQDHERGCALPIARSPAFAGPAACAACHEFEFPEPHLNGRPLLVQSTVAEHAASSASSRSCSSCHMPSERSHAFPGAYDPEMLRRALEIEARRESDAFVLDLRPGIVGHAVPTGDLFRRLEITLFALDANGHERVLERRWLGRHIEPRTRADGLVVYEEVVDDRVGPSGQTLRFELAATERDRRLRWRIVHQRVANPKGDGDDASIEGEIEFASGIIEAPSGI